MLSRLSAVILLCAAVGCATASRVVPRDDFPLDPREEVPGPYSPDVEEGSRALLSGDNPAALRAFTAAREARHGMAAEIGWIEVVVLAGRPADARVPCDAALAAGEPTLPLLVGCGEARARSGDEAAGYELYARAAASHPDRRGVKERAEELQRSAAQKLMVEALADSASARFDEARRKIASAIEVAPDSAALRSAAAQIEAAAGDRERAIQRYREALERDPRDLELRERAAELALEGSDYGLAASLYDELAQSDPRFQSRAREARLAFRVANWPAPEREAARSERLTRAGAADLVWWMFPEVREARVSSAAIATDVVGRRDSRALARAVALGLLDTDHETHRAHPDQPLLLPSAARLAIRLLSILGAAAGEPCEGVRRPPRLPSEIVRVAVGCGLFEEDEPSPVSGPAFTRALDRVRELASDPSAER
jgi:tetratricopeptide (TPR) repeat protein